MVVNGVRQLVGACACLKQAPTPFGALRPRKSEWWNKGGRPLPARWNIPDRERPQRMIALASWRQQLGPSVADSPRDLFGDGDRVGDGDGALLANRSGKRWKSVTDKGGAPNRAPFYNWTFDIQRATEWDTDTHIHIHTHARTHTTTRPANLFRVKSRARYQAGPSPF
jgi:hypothetical protein